MLQIKKNRKAYSYYLRIGLVILFLLSLSFPALSRAVSQSPTGDYYRVRSMEIDELDISRPAGLAFSLQASELLVMEDPSTWIEPGNPPLTKITLRELPAGSITPEINITDPLNMAFDVQSDGLYVFDKPTQELVRLRISPGGPGQPPGQVTARFNAAPFRLQNPAGIAFDPQSGRIFILDAAGPTILGITPHPVFGFDGPAAVSEGRVNPINLTSLRGENLRGMAYNPNNGHLYTMNPQAHVLYELTETGQVVSVRDLSELNLADPQAMVFAPSGDSTDDPATMNLYIADSGQPSSQGMTSQGTASENLASQGGQLIELALVVPDALPPGTTLLPVTLVRIVDTSIAAWNPSDPDTSDIAYRPSTGRFMTVDSEVEEMSPLDLGRGVPQ